MTTKHKKRTPLIRRLSSIVAVFAIFIMSMPMAQAAEMETTLGGHMSYGSGSSFSGAMIPTITIPVSNYGGNAITYARGNTDWFINYWTIGDTTTEYTGAVGVYLSYYTYSSAEFFTSTGFVQKFKGEYTNHQGTTGTLTTVDVQSFTPSVSNAKSVGHSISAKFVGTEDLPISNLRLENNSGYYGITHASATNNRSNLAIYFTSARVVSTEYSAELGAMENMANQIAQQNQMMQAMYGEIIALCNAIYQKCGDLETAINLTNSYCSAMLDALGDIATTTDNIYQLLGTQFALLISTIETESSNIQDAIAQAEAKLEAYFDAVGSGAVGTLPEETEDIEDKADGLIEDESAYESDASEQFADIVASFNGFSGGALNGVALATDLFTQIWNVLGEWKVVYTFPLIMGLVLLVIGRMSRFSGTMNSRNNGDKDVGGD